MPTRSLSATPSVLLISLDTTRADRLGCYGHEAAATPHLDRWAGEGVVFENALTPVPVTLPAHASLLTGRLPHRHGVRDNAHYRLPADSETLATRLAAAGYDTAAVVAAAVLDRHYGLDRGFRLYDDAVSGERLEIAEREAAEVTDRAVSVARDLKSPFFLFVHYFDPHADYEPPAPFAERFRSSPYDGEIAYVDEQIGRLRRELEAQGRLEDTVVVVTADHGESLGEHGEDTHGVFLYQSTLHVPLIVVAPGVWPAGARVGVPVSLVDVVPTLLDLVGQPPPPDLDGQSLSGSVTGEPTEARWFPLESEFGFNSFGWAPLTGLTDGRQKWIGAPEPELYDLVRDPGETRNRAGERPDEEERLARMWRERVSEDRRSPLDPASAGDAERLARLAALGYVPTTAGASREDADLPDPKRAMGDLVSINRALGLIEGGRISEAERTVAEVARRSPRNVSALVLLGSVRLMGGRPAEAVEPLRRATAIAPGNAEAHFNLGLALVAVDRIPEAEGAWRRSLSLNPRRHDAAANLVDLLLRARRLDDAQAVLDEARHHRIEDPMLDYLEGRLAILRRDADGARAALTRALEGGLPEATDRHARELLRRLPS